MAFEGWPYPLGLRSSILGRSDASDFYKASCLRHPFELFDNVNAQVSRRWSRRRRTPTLAMKYAEGMASVGVRVESTVTPHFGYSSD